MQLVHVSPDGKTVVALLTDSRLLIIKDIIRLIKGEVTLQDSALEVYLSCPEHPTNTASSVAIYLAFEHGRIGVITVSRADNRLMSDGADMRILRPTACSCLP